jgi:hypothetical protein
MIAPTYFGITLPSSGSVPSAFWEMLNWGAVDRIKDQSRRHCCGTKHKEISLSAYTRCISTFRTYLIRTLRCVHAVYLCLCVYSYSKRRLFFSIILTGRGGRRRKQLLADLKERREYRNLKLDALYHSLWRNGHWRSNGAAVWKITERIDYVNRLVFTEEYKCVFSVSSVSPSTQLQLSG